MTKETDKNIIIAGDFNEYYEDAEGIAHPA